MTQTEIKMKKIRLQLDINKIILVKVMNLMIKYKIFYKKIKIT